MIARGNDRPALWVVAEDGDASEGQLRRAVRPVRTSSPTGCAPGCAPGRPRSADAAATAAAVGDHAGRDEAGRRRDPGDHAARSATTCATASSAAGRGSSSPWPTSARSSTHGPGRLHALIAVGGAPAGWPRYEGVADARRRFTPDGETRPTTRCCSTSPPAPPPSPSWSSTPTQLSGRPPVDHVLDRAAAGRRAPEHLLPRLGEARLEQRLRALERRRRRCSSTTTPASTRRGCWT